MSIGEAWKRKYPELIAFATSVDAQGRPNIIVLGWMMPTSGTPPMVAISVGHPRHSHETIRAAGDFVVAFPSSEMSDATMYCGTRSGRDGDKFGPAVEPTGSVCVLSRKQARKAARGTNRVTDPAIPWMSGKENNSHHGGSSHA